MGYALLAGLAAVVVLVSTAIFIGVGGGEDGSDAAPPPRNPADPAGSGTWVGTWAAPATGAEPQTRRAGSADTTVRNVVHTSVGGTRARVRLSNLFGNGPLTVSHATLALAAAPSNPTAAAGSMRTLTFGAKRAVTIPPGGEVTSDAVRLNVPSAADVLVSVYTPEPAGPVTHHSYARQTSYASEGDQAADVAGNAYTEQVPYWRYLTGVDVWSTEAEGSVVVMGDSLTDGVASSPGANRRWTDFLAERLRTERDAPRYSVLNSGISGNRILTGGSKRPPLNNPSGLSRMKRDALSQTGVKAVIIELGLNDLLRTPRVLDSDRIVQGLRELVRQAHAQGVRAIGGTLTPFGRHRGYDPRVDAVRQQVNEQIRSGKVFDAVIDFDAALRDPAHPERLRTAYDSGDHLHPSDNGYRAMSEAVDLKLLKSSTAAKL
ncbi:SGNH/GDSL hydrolase family protein [Streptomyces armeniacus]|uniref:SGNH/GDSL hydrolase family protein n=2 Tax=Streptomyces armeniacus TaxID=83291 RepID=A0A345XRQ4_9ACTN|nr:SGNH/GDSL hydrolase family protein [Streptomyces armeniacus]